MDAARQFSHADISAAAFISGLPEAASRPVYAIDDECAGDVVARELLLDRAMGAGRKRKSSEKLRRGRLPAEGLSLVARSEDRRMIGTVRLWHVALGQKGSRALLLGPLAVDPDVSGLGIGGALMKAAIGRAAALGHGAILLVGDPEYYSRFGFHDGKTAELAMPGPFEKHRLLALELVEGAIDAATGIIRPAGLVASRV